MSRVALVLASLAIACASPAPHAQGHVTQCRLVSDGDDSNASPNEAPDGPGAAASGRRVRFVSSSGILACSWLNGDDILRRGVSPLQAELDRCADQHGDDEGVWSVQLDIRTDGSVESASFPPALEGAGEPPACVVDMLAAVRFESGPPACGSVRWLRFEVDARR